MKHHLDAPFMRVLCARVGRRGIEEPVSLTQREAPTVTVQRRGPEWQRPLGRGHLLSNGKDGV